MLVCAHFASLWVTLSWFMFSLCWFMLVCVQFVLVYVGFVTGWSRFVRENRRFWRHPGCNHLYGATQSRTQPSVGRDKSSALFAASLCWFALALRRFVSLCLGLCSVCVGLCWFMLVWPNWNTNRFQGARPRLPDYCDDDDDDDDGGTGISRVNSCLQKNEKKQKNRAQNQILFRKTRYFI